MSSTLGFYDLMNMAEQNAEQTARKAKTQKFASFECPKPKKLDPKQKVLSDNIQKFLNKKKEEERRAQEEEKRKKEKLLALRSQDKKATKRVGQMLRMTKSANKSVLADAKNSLEDSLVEQDGYQPDEDDYGYVSQHAAEYHKKMMEKYRALPVNKPTPTKTPEGIPVPQSQSLKKSKSSDEPQESSPIPIANARKPKQQSRPVPYNFDALMKLAEVNSKEPVEAPKPKPMPREEEKFEFGRPMTAKEKAEYLLEKEARARIERGIINMTPKEKITVPSKAARNVKTATPSTSKAKSLAQPAMQQKVTATPIPKPAPSFKAVKITTSNAKIPPHTPQPGPSKTPKATPEVDSKKPKQMPRRLSNESHSAVQKNQITKQAKPVDRDCFSPPSRSQPAKHAIPETLKQQPRESLKLSNGNSRLTTNDLKRSSQQVPQLPKPMDVRAKVVHKDIRSPPRPVRDDRRLGPSYSNVPKQTNRQVIVSDDEEDYDSEMDDFIDDSEVNPSQISDLIRNITGYDKRKYKDTSDDECMESNVWQQMREEQRSLRIGIQEDLEDIRREEEENKRKEMRKKRKLK